MRKAEEHDCNKHTFPRSLLSWTYRVELAAEPGCMLAGSAGRSFPKYWGKGIRPGSIDPLGQIGSGTAATAERGRDASGWVTSDERSPSCIPARRYSSVPQFKKADLHVVMENFRIPPPKKNIKKVLLFKKIHAFTLPYTSYV